MKVLLMVFQFQILTALPEANLFFTSDNLYAFEVRSKFNELIVLPSPVNWTAIGAHVVGPCVISKRARRAFEPERNV